MAKPRTVTFQEFRYQILPTSRTFQTDFLNPDIGSIDDLIRKKNDFFNRALMSIEAFSFSHTEVVHQLLFVEGTKSVFRIGAQRSLDRETRSFTHEAIDNWPSLLVIINNDNSEQTMLIEKNARVFQLPKTVATLFQDNINARLEAFHLQCYVEPMFEQAQFWTLINRYEGRIKVVDFELISPNLPNISSSLTIDLKQINNVTNSIKTNLRFESPPDGTLSIKESDPLTKGLVDYASEGGGNIKIKVKDLKKRLNTKNTVKEISIAEVEITGKNGAEILDILRSLL